MWQDYVFACGTLVFCAGAFKALGDKRTKISFFTSFSSALVLCAFCVAQSSLGLRYTAMATALQAFLWFGIARNRS